jgi:hypothetical protein
VEEIDVVTLVTLALVGVTVRVLVMTVVTFALNVDVRADVDVGTLAGFLLVRRVAQKD